MGEFKASETVTKMRRFGTKGSSRGLTTQEIDEFSDALESAERRIAGLEAQRSELCRLIEATGNAALLAEFQLQRIRRLCIGVTGEIEPLTPSSKDRQIEELSQYISELEHERNRSRHELVRLRGIAAYVEAE